MKMVGPASTSTSILKSVCAGMDSLETLARTVSVSVDSNLLNYSSAKVTTRNVSKHIW